MSTTRRRGGSTTEAPRPLGAGCSAPFFPSGDGAAHKRRLSIVLRPDPQIPFSPPAVGGNWKDREGRRRDGGRGRPLGRVSRPHGQPVGYLQPSCPAPSPPSSPPPPKLLPPAASPAERARGPRSHRAASSPRSQLASLPRVASPKKKKKKNRRGREDASPCFSHQSRLLEWLPRGGHPASRTHGRKKKKESKQQQQNPKQ